MRCQIPRLLSLFMHGYLVNCTHFLSSNMDYVQGAYANLSFFCRYVIFYAKYKFYYYTIPLQLLVTKDVVNDTLSAMGYPGISMICLNQ
jgi:hypothetical protein